MLVVCGFVCICTRPGAVHLLQDGDTGGTVEQVAAAIKARKAQLAPAIQELRSLRQRQQVRHGQPDQPPEHLRVVVCQCLECSS